MGLAKKSRSEEQDFTLVRMNGFEPSTPCMSSKYSNQLSYASMTRGIITHLLRFDKGVFKLFTILDRQIPKGACNFVL